MKEKMLQVKEYVIAHKKQIIIGAGVLVIAAVSAKPIIKKLKAVEVSDDTLEEITGGAIEKVTSTEEA